jgi:CoA:oxalate CoA-transferase
MFRTTHESSHMTRRPLQNVSVLEICSFVAGPYCTRLLSDMGANVVKIEPPGEGDPARQRGPFFQDIPNPEHSLLFLYVNANKRSVTLNLGTSTGRRILTNLISMVDLLVEDLSPTQRQCYDLGYATLHDVNPSLIVASITPFGLTGPHSDYKASYLNSYHSGGDAYIMPGGQLQDEMFPKREPIKGAGYIGEYQVGQSACVAILAALFGHSADRRGHHIDISKQEVLTNLNGPDFGRYPNNGIKETRYGRYIANYVGGLFRCKDGYWEFLINSDRAWNGMMEFMGDPDWAKDSRFGKHEDRVLHRREIEDRIEAWAADYSREDLYHGLQQRGCPAGPTYYPTEIISDKLMRERGFWESIQHPSLGHIEIPSGGVLFSKTPPQITSPSPSLGEHNHDIYTTWAGISEKELSALQRDHVI